MSMNTAELSRCIASEVAFGKTLRRFMKWWAYLELNQGPRPYQGRALTN